MRKILAAIMLMTTFTVWAGDFEDGMAAYDKKDYATAVKKFKSAAEQGDTRAQYDLGEIFKNGVLVPQDYAEAFRFYKMATGNESPTAQVALGSMFKDGLGTKQDYVEASRWYKLAAEEGDFQGQLRLGQIHSIKKEYVKAHMWWNLAIANGGLTTTLRDLIAKQMTPQQIAQAQKLATECLARNYKNCD